MRTRRDASRTELAHTRVAATDVLYAAERNGAERIGPDAKRLRSVPDTNVLLPAKTVSVNKPASVEAQSSKKG